MSWWVVGTVCVLLGVVLVATLVLIVRDRSPGDPMFVLLGVTELALVVQAVWGVVALTGTDRDVNGVFWVSYLLAVLLVLPVGAFWSLAERSRAGTAVLLVAAFAVLAVELRLDAIWDGAGA